MADDILVISKEESQDLVTGLPNRNTFLNNLAKAVKNASLHVSRVAIVYIGMDFEADFTGLPGHEMRARLLQAIAGRLSNNMRKDDIIARIVGNEFAIFIENVFLLHNLAKVAEKVIEVLSMPYIVDGCKFQTNVKIGISIYPSDGITALNLINNAHEAMLRIRGERIDKVQFYGIRTESIIQGIKVEDVKVEHIGEAITAYV